MNGCEECPGVAVAAVARTMTTVIVALASVIVLALAGCASPRGIESSATLAAPAAYGADPAGAVAPVAADWWRGFDDPVLADLIERATAGSPTLRGARRRERRLGACRRGAAAERCARPDVAALH